MPPAPAAAPASYAVRSEQRASAMTRRARRSVTVIVPPPTPTPTSTPSPLVPLLVAVLTLGLRLGVAAAAADLHTTGHYSASDGATTVPSDRGTPTGGADWSSSATPRLPRPPAVAVPLAAALLAAAPTEAAPGADWPLDVSDVPPPAVRFVTDNSSIVTAQTGSTALIPCVVSNLGDGMVSWIRRKDYHLLTVGLVTYTGDDRYQAIHVQHSEDWTLQIKYVQQRDAGLYECQVSSHPPTSIFIDLRVVEARAEIAGPSEKYLKLGSALRLVCTVRQSTEPPVYVFWYHNNRMVNYDADRGINVTTDRPAKSSTLLVPSATRDHSGNYSCVPNDAQPASTYVHILNGENPAAMQHGGRALSWLRCPSAWLLLASVAATLCAGPAAVVGASP